MSSPKVSRAGAEWQEPGQRRALGKLQHHQLRASPESRRCSDGRWMERVTASVREAGREPMQMQMQMRAAKETE